MLTLVIQAWKVNGANAMINEAMNNTVKQVDKIVEALESRKMENWKGDEISRAISELAVLKVRLGELVADAEFMYQSAYNARKYNHADNSLRHSQDNTISKAKELAELGNKENRRAESETLRDYRYLRNKYEDIGTLIMTLQSRLKYLRDEKVESNYQT